MQLPIRGSVDDVLSICTYLAKKPMGATLKDAKAVLDSKTLSAHKLTALKYWGFIDDDGDKMKITELGREVIKGGGNTKKVLNLIIQKIDPYRAIMERAYHRKEDSLTTTDIARHWHEHFKSEISSNEKLLNEQVLAFLQIVTAAELGKLIVGRRGSLSRISFDHNAMQAFFKGAPPIQSTVQEKQFEAQLKDDLPGEGKPREEEMQLGQAIFIGHGKNKAALEQLKKILEQFKVPFKVAVEEPSLGRPISGKIREIMQSCNCAILIFTADEEFRDKKGNTIWRPTENVIHELGAAGYLYDNRIVILKEEEVNLPSNFRDLGYISFAKDQLENKAMDILKELIGFKILKVTT
jgi:predicted nucleotide-binding protein